MKKTIFKGAATALVTPSKKDDSPDLEAYARLIDWQINEGIDALVGCGTTGESSTLSDREFEEVIAVGVKACAGRVPFIAGTGSNDISHAIERTKTAEKLGADAALVVTPYYNKATQKGLVASYTAIADSSRLPVIVYNVPSRTGVNVKPETYGEMADHPRIVAIKEANGDISSVAQTLAIVGDRMDLYSGNDDQTVPILALGGKGVISVLSNPLPRLTAEITKKFFAGDIVGSAALQLRLLPLIKALFCEVNPIPAKAAMSAMGYGENVLRLPLTPMEEGNKEKLFALLRKEGVGI